MIARRVRAYHNHIQQFLFETAEAKARQTRFVQRRSPLTGSLFVQTLIWTVFQTTTRRLQTYVDTLETLAPEVSVTLQAFHERFTPNAVCLLRALFAEALAYRVALTERTRPILTRFSALYILDSSAVALPDAMLERFRGWGGKASKAAAKVFVVLEWFSGSIDQIQVHDGRTPDQGMGTAFLASARSAALWLFDLGFWSCKFLAQIACSGFFLCRLQVGVTAREPVDGQDQTFDLDAWLREQAGSKPVERPVVIGSGPVRVQGRLIAVAVPEQVAAERRRKLKRTARRQGRTLKKSTLFRQGYSLWVTNASPIQIPASVVAEIYRVRWQVELIFKLAKSDAGLARFTSRKAERVECELYAVLIALVWAAQIRSLISTQIDDISLVKLWRRLETRVLLWGHNLRRRRGLTTFRQLLEALSRHARPSKRRRYPSTRQRLEAIEVPMPNCSTNPSHTAASPLPAVARPATARP